MRDSFRWVPVYVFALMLVAGLAGHVSQDVAGAAPVQSRLTSSERDTIPDITGTWTGTWEDTIYTWASGTLEWTIVLDRQDMSATGTIGMDELQSC